MKVFKMKTVARRWIVAAGLVAMLVLPGIRSGYAVHSYDDGTWMGKIGFMSVLWFYVKDSQLTILRLVAVNACNERETGEYYEYSVNLGKDALGSAPGFHVTANGRIEGGFTVDRGVYKGLTIDLKGNLNNKSGQVVVTLSSATDLQNCAHANIFKMQWAMSRNIGG